jgi:hypothetical protein
MLLKEAILVRQYYMFNLTFICLLLFTVDFVDHYGRYIHAALSFHIG